MMQYRCNGDKKSMKKNAHANSMVNEKLRRVAAI